MQLNLENLTLFNFEKLKFVLINNEFITFFSENAKISFDKKWKYESKKKKKISDQIISNIVFEQYFDQLSSSHDSKNKIKVSKGCFWNLLIRKAQLKESDSMPIKKTKNK